MPILHQNEFFVLQISGIHLRARESTKIKWRIAGEEVGNCNCSWGCPCQFNAIEPIKNPVTGQEHRARIALPNGFEYKEAETGNTVSCRVSSGDKLTFELKNTYAQLNAFDWNN